MSIDTFGSKNRKIGAIVICYILAVVLLVLGLIIGSKSTKDYVEVKATVVEIEEVVNSVDENDIISYVYVDFTYNGKEYSHVQLLFTSGNLKEGQELTILCDPNDPTQTSMKGDSIIVIIMFVASIGALIGGIVLTINYIKELKMMKEMKDNPIISSGNLD